MPGPGAPGRGNFRSGRHRKPTALHMLQGTKSRTDRRYEPRPALGRPEPTAEIRNDPTALQHWESLADRLERVKVLTVNHGEGLALLAQALADYGRVREQLREMGFRQLIVDEVRDPKNPDRVLRRRVRENPLLRRSERLAMLVERLLGDFGLTPISQSKVHSERESEPDPFEVFLGGKSRKGGTRHA